MLPLKCTTSALHRMCCARAMLHDMCDATSQLTHTLSARLAFSPPRLSTVKVGTCLASLPPYRAGDKTSQWYTVSDDDGNATGEVMLQVEWGATPAGLAGGLPSPPTPSAFGYTATPPSFGYTGSAAAGAGAGFGVGAGGGAGIAATATATATPLGPHGFPTVLDGKYTDLVLLVKPSAHTHTHTHQQQPAAGSHLTFHPPSSHTLLHRELVTLGVHFAPKATWTTQRMQ